MTIAFSFSVVPTRVSSFSGRCVSGTTRRWKRTSIVHSARSAHMNDSSMNDHQATPKLEVGLDELQSDDEYVVVDGRDVEALIREMQQTGEDALLALEDEPERLLEKRAKNEEPTEPVMEYFKEDNMMHMPRWAREAYENGSHEELERASSKLSSVSSPRRLHALVEGGVTDCSVQNVADDYGVPIEFVSDILLEYGVKSPQVDDMLKERCSDKDIESMLYLISSFDAQDLSDRYSDRSLSELAEDFELNLEVILQVCADEGIHCVLGRATRLQNTREDRVLDILLRDGPRKKPYPSLLEGLVAPA